MAKADAQDGGDGKPAGKRKLLLVIVPVLLLAGIGGGLWVSGILPHLLGTQHNTHAEKDAQANAAKEHEAAERPPTFLELPEIIANLNAGAKRNAFIKVKVRLELAGPEDVQPLQAALPRVQDLFTTYLREMRPEELHGSMGTYRLREELIARTMIAAPRAHVVDVLFTDMIVQ